MKNPLKNGTLIAITAASLFASACSKKADNSGASGASADKTAQVACQGVNACKGKSACKTAQNACAGQNGCKGQGFVKTTADDCQAKGGTVMAAK